VAFAVVLLPLGEQLVPNITYGPGDFAGSFEAYIGGALHTFDPRNNMPRINRVLMAQGRDASDNRHARPVIFRETGMRLDGPIASGCKRKCVGRIELIAHRQYANCPKYERQLEREAAAEPNTLYTIRSTI
jgi:hypothetical protein